MLRLGVVVTLALVACTRSIADDGQSCVLNSDCRSPLVCAASYCRPQCREARDCASGETCHGFGESAVCVPDGMAVPCAFGSQCGAGQECIDGTCRAACTSDAECAGGTCTMGACSMPITGGGDAGTSACPGAMCGGRCVDLMTDSEHCGSCPVACATGTSCVGGDCVGCDPTMPGCRPSYDECETPLRIDATLPRTVLDVPTVGTQDSAPSCGSPTDWFAEVHVPDRAVVWAGLTCVGSQAFVGVVDACTDPLAACNDCQSAAAYLDTTSSVLLDFECSGPASTVLLERIPITGATDVEPFPTSNLVDATPTFPAGAGMGLCGSSGGSHVWYVDSCNRNSARLRVDTCGSTSPLSLAFIDSSGGVVCEAPRPATAPCTDAPAIEEIIDVDGVVAFVVSETNAGTTGGIHVHATVGP